MFKDLLNNNYQEIQESNDSIKRAEVELFKLNFAMNHDNDLSGIIKKVNEFRQLQQLMIGFDEAFNKLKELDEEGRLSLGLDSIIQDKKTKLLKIETI